MDTESYYGNMLIAFGANFFRKLGGQNRAEFPLRHPHSQPFDLRSATLRSSTGASSWFQGSSWNSRALELCD